MTGPGAGYRHRARLSVRPGGAGAELGIFELGSHRLVSIPECLVHHPSIRALHELLARELEVHAVPAYDEAQHAGVLRAVQMAVERSSGRVQLVLIVRDRLGPGSHARKLLGPLLSALSQASELVHSVWLNAQPERTNTLLGERFEHVSGPPTVVDESGGVRVFYPPDAFGQANPALHDEAVRRIHAAVPAGARVVEFHAGVGTIGLGLCERCSVGFNELGTGSLGGLALGIDALPASVARPSVHAGPADAHVALLSHADFVVVDPPRKGLSGGLLEALMRDPPVRLAYLSCGLDSFLRDAERLVETRLRLVSATAFGYFPYTEHIETLAFFERVD